MRRPSPSADIIRAANVLNRLAGGLARLRFEWKRGATRDLLRIARKWSSGRLTDTDLRRMDHPYARRHGRQKLNPAMINRRTGAFFDAWNEDQTAGLDYASITNTDPKAELYLQPGTSKMFARPIDEAILAEAVPEIEARLRYELERALR